MANAVALVMRGSFPVHAWSFERVYRPVYEQLRQRLPMEWVQLPSRRVTVRDVGRNVAVFRRIQADIIHITGETHYLALAARRPVVLTVHDCRPLRRSGVRQRIFDEFWFRRPMRAADIVTTGSAYTASELHRTYGVPLRHVHVVPHFVTPGITRSDPTPMAGVLKLLQVGAAPNKNLSRLITAAAGLPIALRVIGRPIASDITLAREMNVSMEWFANVDSEFLDQSYAWSDAVAVVSTYEGFGLVVLEAQQAGRPVIVSTAASLPEVSGPSVPLVDPYAPAEIGAALRRMIGSESLRHDLVAAGLENVRRYSLESTCDGYLAIYRQLLAG